MATGLATGVGGFYNGIYPEYIGPVATRCRINNFYSTSTSVQYIQSRTRHVAMDNISQIQILFSDIYPSGTSENSISLGGTITCSVEYPAGTFTQIKFGGNAQGTLNNTNLVSDMTTLSVPIPVGAAFWVRNYRAGTGTNFPYSVDGLNWVYQSASGEACDAGSTARTDQTMSGSITNNSFQNIIYRPTAILGYTTKATFFLAGDSRTRASGSGGNLDLNYDVLGLIGELERGFYNKGFAVINGSVSGDSYFNVTQAGAYTKRGALAAYCKIIIDNYGINDLGTGATLSAAQLNSYCGLLKAVTGLAGKPYYKPTLSPRSTSTDNYLTTTNQTTVASNTSRVGWNNALRAGTIANVDGYIEIADINESARDSGLWDVSSIRKLTADVNATNASANITSTGSNFLTTDQDRSIYINGVGSRNIKSITSTAAAVMQSTSGATVSNQDAYIGRKTTDGLHNQVDADLAIANSTAFNVFNSLVS